MLSAKEPMEWLGRLTTGWACLHFVLPSVLGDMPGVPGDNLLGR